MKGTALPLVWRSAATGLRRARSLAKEPVTHATGAPQFGEKRPEAAAVQLKKGFWCKERLLQIFTLTLVLTLCSTIYVFRDTIEGLGDYGYLGAFLIPMLCSATIVVPVPGLLLVFTLGGVLNPLLVGLVSGVGGTIGEMTGYLLGYSGRAAIENARLYQRMEHMMKRWGAVTLFVLALIPNPIFDIAGAVAGALRFPLWKFLLFGGAGRIIKHTVFAFAGAWGLEFLLRFLG